MKLLLSFLFSIIFTVTYAQEVIGFLKLNDGEKINIYENKNNIADVDYRSNFVIEGDVTFTPTRVFYFNASNDLKETLQTKIEVLEFDGRIFKNLQITKIGMKRLHEVLIYNDKYLLTNYSSNMGNYFYVFDKNSLKMVNKKTQHSTKRKNDYKSLDKVVRKYFSNCGECLNQIKQNIRSLDYAWKDVNGNWILRNNMFNGFKNYKCN